MDLVNYKNLSTSEKILLVEEIWDSIAEDKNLLCKNTKKILNSRLLSSKKSTKRVSWEEVKKGVRTKKI